ncbi:hypothetical protein Pla108_00470 [Botrimarina colliarenosi]|uniref:DUF1573 domain-containing protein n=1 Tax=Botrimarina colliarenosi TaxID=2528001 RepID=A0A5C6AGL2_9BACT|nr:DUF1573 domain-containing protein [Botrimarina colliarenosi]TWT99114.1 hypothetical protein Pla108_00470 [Botrimarina colliarenosi]
MKLLPIALVSLACGAGLGVALAYVEVGPTETAFAPAPREGETFLPQGAGSVGPTALKAEGPVATVDAAIYDFGTMQRGVTETHEFIFTNEGTSPLTLEVGRTSCKCTLGAVANRPLKPGESTPVKLEWVAKSLPGEFRQVASVLTNDPRRPTIELTVEGVITETAGLSPEEFLLGRIAADEVATATVYLASYDEEATEPVRVEAMMPSSAAMADHYRFDVEPVEGDDLPLERASKGVKITVTAGPGLPIGHITEWVTVKTNLQDGKPSGAAGDGSTLQVPLLAVVEGDISLHGAHWSKERSVLNLGTVSSREGKESKLRLSFKGDHADATRAEVASVDPEWLEVDLAEPIKIRDGVVHQPMTVRIPPGRQPQIRSGAGAEAGGVGDGDALIRLKTNHPTSSELDVKVRFVIAQ